MVSPLGSVPFEMAKTNDEMRKLERLQHKLGKPTGNSWKTSQHLAALGASLGALATGTTISWSMVLIMSKVMNPLNVDYNFVVTEDDLNRTSWMLLLGGATICFPITFMMNKIGRRTIMLLLVIPFTIGWALITWAQNVTMLILGRFITGMAAGAFCVTTPVYISEIAQESIRGTLGSYIQLMYTIGVTFTLFLGALTTVSVLNIACACISLLSGVVFYFIPETPSFLVAQEKHDEARRALVLLRGSEYEAEVELDKLKRNAENSKNYPVSITRTIDKKSTRNAIVICLTLIVLQDIYGVDRMYAYSIFLSSTGYIGISRHYILSYTVVIMVLAAMSTIITTVTVDRFGRRILLLASSLIMCLTSVAGAILEGLTEKNFVYNDNVVGLPGLCLSVFFLMAYFVGSGPLMWITIADLCQVDGKLIVVSTAGTFFYLSHMMKAAFTGNLLHLPLTSRFSLFASIHFLTILFVIFVVPETKGKSNEEIESLLGANDRRKVQLEKP